MNKIRFPINYEAGKRVVISKRLVVGRKYDYIECLSYMKEDLAGKMFTIGCGIGCGLFRIELETRGWWITPEMVNKTATAKIQQRIV